MDTKTESGQASIDSRFDSLERLVLDGDWDKEIQNRIFVEYIRNEYDDSFSTNPVHTRIQKLFALYTAVNKLKTAKDVSKAAKITQKYLNTYMADYPSSARVFASWLDEKTSNMAVMTLPQDLMLEDN